MVIRLGTHNTCVIVNYKKKKEEEEVEEERININLSNFVSCSIPIQLYLTELDF